MELTKMKNNYFLFLLKNKQRFVILYTLCLFAAYPLFTYFVSGNLLNDLVVTIGKALIIIFVFLACILIPLSLFKYTTTKSSLDVYDALPITKEKLFHLNYVAGLILLIGPFFLVWLIGSLYACYGPATTANFFSIMDYTRPSFANEMLAFVKILPSCIACYSITVFSKQNTGSTIDSFIYTGILHLIPILLFCGIQMYLTHSLFGYPSSFPDELFRYVSPIFTLFLSAYDGIEFQIATSLCIYYCIIDLLLFYFSTSLYLRHKPERAGQPFINKYFYPIVSTLLASSILICLLCSFDGGILAHLNLIVYPLIIVCIIYLIIDSIAARGFKHLLKGFINYLCIVAVSLLVLVPIDATNGFGYETVVPSVENIESITLSTSYAFNNLYQGFNEPLIVTSNENKEKITAWHKEMLQEAHDYNYDFSELYNDFSFTQSVHIQYTLYNGKTIERHYFIPKIMANDLFNLDFNDDFASLYDFDSLRKELFIDDCNFYIDDYLGQGTRHAISKEDTMCLIDAMEMDFQNRKYQDPTKLKVNIYTKLNVVANDDFTHGVRAFTYNVEVSDKNTIEILKSLNTKPSTYALLDDYFNGALLIYPSTEKSSFIYHLGEINFDAAYGQTYIDLSKEDVEALLPYMRDNTNYDEQGYIVLVHNSYNTYTFVLDRSYSYLVDKFEGNKRGVVDDNTLYPMFSNYVEKENSLYENE